ncbi:Membrane protein involved in the export of O-antigen and teichoic acid [Chitinophaga jiangningensis]|uniref:Membrane protein involved in the export of O-antigen and teichoic acid n=1 Tax=Chitinophaga jiangningensis TaxID=1419482 RepID=A0A1M7M658_9BACT|nr:oligosaccharide flippase family protein [Chitinophaga jiangningensis]SHM86187.1 Membrane protein involved in the export of O-antigen and teichoic acid [Chitinophaga jiangningensis]
MGIVRKQSLYSSISIYIGFAFGAFNQLVLFPRLLNAEQYGLKGVLIDVATLMATVASLGAVPAINKFFPFYKDYLTRKNNDLPFITSIVAAIGFLLFLVFAWLFKGLIIQKFSGNSMLFVDYFYIVYPLTFFIMVFNLLEAFAWGLKKTIASNFLKENLLRVATTVILIIYAVGSFSFSTFMWLFCLPYALIAVLLWWVIYRTKELKTVPQLSSVTRRMSKRILIFSGYVFSANVFSLIARTNDLLIMSSVIGLEAAGVYSIATFVASLIEVPQRSMYSITTPILSQAWKDRDMSKIQSLYSKSSITLIILGLGIFGVIWCSQHNLVLFLNHFLNPQQQSIIPQIILVLCIAKLIDLVTGVNNIVIQTSNFWRFDFISAISFVLVSIVLTYILQKKMGIVGAAYATLIGVSLNNLVRFAFIWIKFGMQPLSYKTGITLLLGAACIGITLQIPFAWNLYADTIIRSIVFVVLYVPAVIGLKLSEDINGMWTMVYEKIRKKS